MLDFEKMEITSFHCSFYNPTNHGIVLTIKGTSEKHTLYHFKVIKMNLHGHFWKYLPPGIELTYFPMNLGETWKLNTFQNSVNEDYEDFIIEIFIATKEHGQFGISRSTLYEELKKLSDSVKSVFEIEFLYAFDQKSEVKPFFSLFSTPRLIFESLESTEDQKDARFKGEIPLTIRSKSIFYAYFRWALFPILFLIFLILSCYSPETFSCLSPKIIFRDKPDLGNNIDIDKLDLRNNKDTFDLIPLYQKLIQIRDGKITNLTMVKEVMADFERKINQILLLCYILLGFLLLCLFSILWELGIWKLLHRLRILEILIYYLCLALMNEGLRFQTIGSYFSLTGLFWSFGANVYTFFLWGKVRAGVRVYFGYTLLFIFYIIPLEIHYEYPLLDWLSDLLRRKF